MDGMGGYTFQKITPPKEGDIIEVKDGKLVAPDRVVIPYIEGDGIGPEIVTAARRIADAAVRKAYGGKREIVWWEIYAGEKAEKIYGELLPQDTLEAIKYCKVALKGPLATPVGGGYRSVNVAIRQKLDLYANIRPVKWIKGTPCPFKYPERVNWVFFRENTEDVYAGIEWSYDSEEAKKLRKFIKEEFGIELRDDAGIGIKPISKFATYRIVRKAIKYALENGLDTVTLMHKGNIMKFTEGAFMQWGYELATTEFRDKVVTEQELLDKYEGKLPEGKILINDRIADNMMQQIITRPESYKVIVCPNLNGDYITDEANALVGGISTAPGANVGDVLAVVEAIHGTAPKYAGKNVANPTSVTRAAGWLLNYIGWREPNHLIEKAIEKAVMDRKVTQDIARQLGPEVKPLGTKEFADAVIEYIESDEL